MQPEYPHLHGVYQHYKGNLYKVLAVGKHSETLETMVVYEALYDAPECRIWIRPLEMFCGTVEIDGIQKSRFTFTDRWLC